MTPNELKKLRKKLPRGYQEIIIARTGLSLSTISAVMNGHWENPQVIEAAFEILQEKNEREANLKRILES